MKIAYNVFMITLIMFLHNNVFASDLSGFKAKVELTVQADSELKNLIVSYLKRELRELKDIEIVESNPEWLLSILINELKYKDGYSAGIAFTVVSLRCVDLTIYPNLYKNSEINKNTLTLLFGTVYSNPHIYQYTGASNEIKKICSDIIANFDIQIIEPERKIHNLFLSNINK